MDSDSTFEGTSYGPVPGGSMASATVDVRGTVLAWSWGAQWLFGYSPAEAVGRPMAEVFGLEESAPIDFASYPAAWVGEVSARDHNGAPLPLQLYAQPLHDARGLTQWHLVVLGRVGPRKPGPPVGEVELALLREWTLAQSALPVTIFDHKGRVVEINQAMARLSGITTKHAVGLRPRELAPLPVFAELDRLLDQALNTGRLVRHDLHGRVGEETQERVWTVFFSPLRDDDGQVHGASCTVFDNSEQHWARRRLAVLDDASTRIGTTLGVNRTAEEAAEVLVPLFADSVIVTLLEPVYRGAEPTFAPLPDPVPLRCLARHSALGGWGEGVPEPGALLHYPLDSPAGVCLSERRPLRYRIDDSSLVEWLEQSPVFAEALHAYGVRSLMLIPLLVGGRPFGLVLLLRHRRTAPFTEDDLLLAQDVSTKAAVRIDNARRYARERDTALTLQRSLLPQRLPHNSAVEVATRYLPAGFRFGVGGDWYDVIQLSGARVALVVGDVTGHGLHASATMGRLRTAVRALSDVDLAPDELLTYLDDLVVHLNAEEEAQPVPDSVEEAGLDLMSEIGATCLYAIYDPVSRRCVVSRAGHPPPAVVGPDGSVEFAEVPAGPPLGVGRMPFESVEFEVPPDSLLVLYTDGLVESRSRSLEQGLDLLREVLAEPGRPLEAVCDSVVRALLPAGATDDAALLVARTRGLDPHKVATRDLPADPAVVGEVRSWATQRLADWGLEEMAFTTELVVSELVTNAIRYASAPIQLRLIQNGTLICEVSDASNTAPHLRRARTFDEGGRGLFLVAQLSHRWGTRHRTNGKTIWAEQVLPDRQPVAV